MAEKKDGWVNPYTGIGTCRDKSLASVFVPDRPLAMQELAALYYHDDLAARIVDSRPDQAFRKGYKLAGLDEDQLRELESKARELKVDQQVLRTWKFGRCYGSALLFLGAMDGQDPAQPLDLDRVRELRFLNPADRRRLMIQSTYSDPLSPRFGEPEVYAFLPMGIANGAVEPGANVHESRCIRFDGIDTDPIEAARLGGWSYSVLQRCYDVLRKFGTSFASAGILIEEASLGIFKIDGLISMLAGGEADALQARMGFVDMGKSASRSIMLDAQNEDYSRVGVQFQGLPEMLDRMMQRLAAAADMPVSILMGRSSAGMNATGESDFRAWYDTIASEQQDTLTPALLRIYEVMGAGLGIDTTELKIEWMPLEEENKTERADIYSKTSAADVALITAGVLEPEQVTLARFGSGSYDPFACPVVDSDELQRQLEEGSLGDGIDETGE